MKRSEKLSVVLFVCLLLIVAICSVIVYGIYKNKQKEVVKEKPILSSSYQDSYTHSDETDNNNTDTSNSNTTQNTLDSNKNNNSSSNTNVSPNESVAETFENLWNLE